MIGPVSERVLWNFNVDVLRGMHPRWRDPALAGLPAAACANLERQRIMRLHALDWVPPCAVAGHEHLVSMSAGTLRDAARLAAAMAWQEQIRACTHGPTLRGVARVVGRRLLDHVTASGTGLPQFAALCPEKDGHCPLPLRITRSWRQALRALCDGVPPAVGRRMLLRFRPACFLRARPSAAPAALTAAILALYAELGDVACSR